MNENRIKTYCGVEIPEAFQLSHEQAKAYAIGWHYRDDRRLVEAKVPKHELRLLKQSPAFRTGYKELDHQIGDFVDDQPVVVSKFQSMNLCSLLETSSRIGNSTFRRGLDN